jgi:hypothetical protein
MVTRPTLNGSAVLAALALVDHLRGVLDLLPG